VERGAQAYRRRSPAGAREAVQSLTAAVRRDSTYAPAWATLARTYLQAYGRRFDVGGASPDSVLRLAVAAADRAIALDSGSADAWITRGLVSKQVDPTDRTAAMVATRRGLSLDSTSASGWHSLAASISEVMGMRAAIPVWRRSVAIDPSYGEGVAFLALGHYWRRQFDSAAAWADSSVALDPTYLLGRSTVGFIAASRGDFRRARAAFEAARRVSTDVEAANSTAGIALAAAGAGDRDEARKLLARADSELAAFTPIPLHSAAYLSQAAAALGQVDRALAYLRAYAPRADLHFQLHLRCDPLFDPIAGDVRFKALLLRPRPGPQAGC
jgi:tetratricopeptide (TPR) repeat protein